MAKWEADAKAKADVLKRKKQVDSIKFEARSLQKKYKHAEKAYGLKGNYNNANKVKFEKLIKTHMNNANKKVIKGAYHKDPETHFFNKRSGVNVVIQNGQFTTTFKPSAEQLKNLLRNGSLGGSK